MAESKDKASFDVSDIPTPTAEDGKIHIDIPESLADLWERFEPSTVLQEPQSYDDKATTIAENPEPRPTTLPQLNILLLVVGSRGDVQPFIAVAQSLQQHGHRVRLATHPTFRDFVHAHGVEFFDLSGNPAELMAYMVSNPGLTPKLSTWWQGEVFRRRQAMLEVIEAGWRACFKPGEGYRQSFGPLVRKKDRLTKGAATTALLKDPVPFVADAIIANPPSMSHIHCAERLGVPLHIMFTMPWSPTTQMQHPLAEVSSSTGSDRKVNLISYYLVESMIWQGMGSITNRFRNKRLRLDTIHPSRGPSLLHSSKIPHTYLWSSSLLPKPADWGPNINVTGFTFLSSGTSWNAPEDLGKFLASGPPPIYVGFGSVVVPDPVQLITTVLEAVKRTGRRLILSLGWAAGREVRQQLPPLPTAVFWLDKDCPHDWLFPQVACVVHHGGAGTTAAGLRAGRSAVIVPFFGDQFFWGERMWQAGAGAKPIPYRDLSVENLHDGLTFVLQSEVLQRAQAIGKEIRGEQGADAAAESFLRQLPIARLACQLLPSHAAVWEHPKTGVRLSAVAATVLHKHKLLKWNDLKLQHNVPHMVSHGPYEPVSGAAWAVTDLLLESFRGMGEIIAEVGSVPMKTYRACSHVRSKISEGQNVAEASRSADTSGGGEGMDDSRHQLEKNTFKGKSKLPGEYFLTGALRISKAAARAPGTFTAAMADGAHNLPNLWGDQSVRAPAKVTGVSSGALEGCRELFWGVADGISGPFVLPFVGLRREGPGGFFKGFGQGVLGLPVKFFAAANGIVGYPLRGVDVAVTRALDADDLKEVHFQRMLQGEHEFSQLSHAEHESIVLCWQKLVGS